LLPVEEGHFDTMGAGDTRFRIWACRGRKNIKKKGIRVLQTLGGKRGGIAVSDRGPALRLPLLVARAAEGVAPASLAATTPGNRVGGVLTPRDK